MPKIRRVRKQIQISWQDQMKQREVYDWISQASVPHIIAPLVIDTTPKKKTLGELRRNKYLTAEYMPFGAYGTGRRDSGGNLLPKIKIEDIPRSYIVYVIENVLDMEEKWPGLHARLTEVLEKKNNATLPLSEENRR